MKRPTLVQLEKVLLRHCVNPFVPEIRLIVSVLALAAFDKKIAFIEGEDGEIWAEWAGIPVNYARNCCRKAYPLKSWEEIEREQTARKAIADNKKRLLRKQNV